MKQLTSQQENTLKVLDAKLRDYFESDRSGHDFDHVLRVVRMSQSLTSDDANLFVVTITAYLHEIFDDKLQLPFNSVEEVAQKFDLDFEGYEEQIEQDIRSIGFKGGFDSKPSRTLEAKYVSDADLLDAMGAIGIARAFYYAGSKGLPFHDSRLDGVIAENYDEYRNLTRNAIAHFDEKLLKLVHVIETDEGRLVAKKRHEILSSYYDAFYSEIKGS